MYTRIITIIVDNQTNQNKTPNIHCMRLNQNTYRFASSLAIEIFQNKTCTHSTQVFAIERGSKNCQSHSLTNCAILYALGAFTSDS